jgi:hypothetical protein
MNGAGARRLRLRTSGERSALPTPSRVIRRLGRAVLERFDAGRESETKVPDAGLIGLDVSRTPIRLKTRSWVPLAAAALAGALLLAVLRVDVIRIRFGLAESLEEEIRLEGLKRQLTVEMRQLRDPAVLSRRAQDLGFQRAEQLIELPAEGAPLPLPDPSAPPTDLGVEFAAARAAVHGSRP